jgi:LmbE family N-acetylglucosaminyl deacetylase
MAEGVTSRSDRRDRTKSAKALGMLSAAARRANKILGVKTLELLDLPDNRMDSRDRLDVIKAVEAAVARYRPDTVYAHFSGDLNIDHRITHEAVCTACRPLPGQPVRTILFFEVPSSTDWQPPASAAAFAPNWFVDITATLSLKLEALKAYSTEMREWPHARSIEALEHLARWRGASVGAEAAEAFVLGRKIA